VHNSGHLFFRLGLLYLLGYLSQLLIIIYGNRMNYSGSTSPQDFHFLELLSYFRITVFVPDNPTMVSGIAIRGPQNETVSKVDLTY
jgi:hypothetical protein